MANSFSTSAHRLDSQSLRDLAIGTSLDPYGNELITIELDVDSRFGTALCRAVFDPVKKRWKLVTSTDAKFEDGSDARYGPLKATVQKPRRAKLDSWVDHLPLTDHVEYFLQTNWEATPLGHLNTWPEPLRAAVFLVMAETMAGVIYWGPQRVAIANAEMLDIFAGRLKKPSDLMGKPFNVIWPELVTDFEPLLSSIEHTGQGHDTIAVNLFPQRANYVEETFFSGSFLPIRGADGRVHGFYNRARETTREEIDERRQKTLSLLSTPPVQGGRDGMWKHVFEAIQNNARDFPLVFAYSAEDDSANDKCALKLEGGFGLPESGHQFVPAKTDLYEGILGFLPYYRKAKVAQRPIVLHDDDGSLPPELLEGFVWRGFGEQSRSLAVIPIGDATRLHGVMVIGLNPRRPYDSAHEAFLNNFAHEVSANIASVAEREESQRRADRLTKQLAESEKQIRELAEFGPIGLLRVATNGKITWANRQFYEITGHPHDEDQHYEMSFVDIVKPEDQHLSVAEWKVLSEDFQNTSTEIRTNKKYKPPSIPGLPQPEEEDAWILANAYPVVENGELKAIAGAVVDISAYKWAEAVQSRSATAAREAKKMQEAFIDIVSHEMRNPLSAITQLADGISSSWDDLEFDNFNPTVARELVEFNASSAKTILLCAAHQKRVIDDVLTLSKLDAMMLSITPVVVQPKTIVETVLKMFEAEFETSSITAGCVIDDSYQKCKIDWVYLDPSRLTQVFINLLTNAIKFTKLESTRLIQLRTQASSDVPILEGVTWLPTDKKRQDLIDHADWGTGRPVYLLFEVVDTGKGLEQDEMTRLFTRFQQASAKTHIKYGGSGLGLFISRELTEAQGGQIGVRSAIGKGSTFAFYIKSRLAEPPPHAATEVLVEPTAAESSGRRSREGSKVLDPADLPTVITEPLCVLLVEDNIVNATVLTRQLEKLGCIVQVANHGQEAIEILCQSRSFRKPPGDGSNLAVVEFDFILMDVEMPIMDGLACTRRIREMEKEGQFKKHHCIISITANARQEQINTVMQAGADDVITKPFRVAELMAKIETMLPVSRPIETITKIKSNPRAIVREKEAI